MAKVPFREQEILAQIGRSILEDTASIEADTTKIDDAAILGLAGTADSLAYKVHEIEKHFHNSEQVFGNNVNFMGADTPIKFTVVGGDNAWGTELMIHDGTVIESGSAVKKMDINTLYVVSTSAANKISIVEFLSGTAGTAIADITLTDATDLFTKVGHGLVNGDKVIVNSVVTTTGLNSYTVYYVIGVAGNNFQLSLQQGGSAVVLGGGNGTASLSKLTQTSLTKVCVSAAAVNNDATPIIMRSPRVACNQRIFVRAKSETGQTVGIGFLLGLHTYTA